MRATIGYVLASVWLSSCASGSSGSTASDAPVPYRLGQALVIGEVEGGELTPVDGSCDSDVCAAVRERCGDQAYADVVLGADGQVLDVLCFRGNAEAESLGTASVETASAGNNTVLVFDDVADGDDVTGDVVLEGNNAVVYGHGADVSRIGGDLAIDKNNAIVRGVAIVGDVTITKNNAQLAFTEIFGDLTIEGNNTTLAECVVHGAVRIDGVNTVLVNNHFRGARQLSGKNLECNGNTSFEGELADAGAGAASDVVGGTASNGADAGAESLVVCEDRTGPPGGGGGR
jgi:hypothetical protein